MDQAYSRKSEEGLSIDLKEMIWRLLEQWRAILAFVLIIMILFSGLMYVRASGSSSDNSGAPAAVQTREQIINALAPADRDMVSAVYEMLLTKQNLLDYVNSAPVMKVDPYSANRLEMSWYIGADEALKSELASAYRNDLGSDGLASDIQKAWGDQYTLEQTKELIYTGYITNFFDDIDKGTDIVNLKVFIPEGADAAAAEKAVLDNIAKVSAELQSEMGAHDLVLLSSQTSVSTDNDLANFQTNIHTRLYTVNYQINNMKALFNDSQKAAFEKLAAITTGEKPAEEEGTEPQEETKAGPSLLSKRNLAIGFILGVGLTEELAKLIPLLFISSKSKQPLIPQTLVYYGLMSGIAFGVYEGVHYQLSVNSTLEYSASFFHNIARLTSLPFMHAIWCGIAGYFVAFAKLYPDQEPDHFGTILTSRAIFGGEEYLDGFSVYSSPKGYKHLVTYGMTVLYGDEEAFGGEWNGWGYEMTIKLKEPDTESCKWAISMLSNLARYTYTTERFFEPNQFVKGNGTSLHIGVESKITDLLLVRDTELETQTSVYGKTEFIQLVGITQSEMNAIIEDPDNIDKLIALMKADGNEDLVTDMNRTKSYL